MSEVEYWRSRAKRWRDEAATARDPVARATLLMVIDEAEMLAAEAESASPISSQGERYERANVDW
jgi:hypothetical protein